MVGALMPDPALAVDAKFTPLVGIPNVNDPSTATLPEYINALYMLTIAVGALIAVVKIAIAGVKWSMTDVVTSKSEARKDIEGALIGLGILLIPFIVLSFIYPGLVKLDVLSGANPVTNINRTTSPTSGSGATTETSGPLILKCAGRVFGPDETCQGWCLLELNGSYTTTPEPQCVLNN